MCWKIIQLRLWTLGALLHMGLGVATEANESLPASMRAPGVPETPNYWPWLALAGILFLFTVIALAARRRLPFGTGL